MDRLSTIYLVQHNYDLEDSFAAFTTRERALEWAKELALDEAGSEGLERYWSAECDVESGAYCRDGADVWIKVHEVPVDSE